MPSAPHSFLYVLLPQIEQDSSRRFFGLVCLSLRPEGLPHLVNQTSARRRLTREASLPQLPCPQYLPPLVSTFFHSVPFFFKFLILSPPEVYVSLYVFGYCLALLVRIGAPGT